MGAGADKQNVTAPPSAAVGARTAARLAAVQALYQIELTGVAPDRVVAQFLSGQVPEPEGEDRACALLPAPDSELFSSVVLGVAANRDQLDGIIGAALSADWTVERLEILVRLILEAGVYELTLRDDIPPKVSINEYVNVAKAFFEGAETGLINGVLDCVAGQCMAGSAAPGSDDL